MNATHDVYSETNPAFCVYILTTFTTAYLLTRGDGPQIPSIYIALPISLSGDLKDTFAGTNRKTGLSEWIERSPQVQIGLAERVNNSMGIVTEALRFGCFTGTLKIVQEARLQLGDRKLQKGPIKTLSGESSQVIKRAERLGFWFAAVGSTRTLFDIVGLTV